MRRCDPRREPTHGQEGDTHATAERPWTILDSEPRYRDDDIEVVRDEVLRPDGRPGSYATATMKPGAAVLVLDADGAVSSPASSATRSAARRSGVAVLELHTVCSEDSDFANPIEPSSAGGRKIARALREALTT